MDKIQIVIAAHKSYRMPDSEIYLPLQVGAEGKESLGYAADNTGDNISEKNPGFCELTGLYWAWKNVEAEYIGLVHYRRHFSVKNPIQRKSSDRFSCILDTEEAETLVKKYDVIVPKKRRYYIESLYTHYAHTHYIEHLDETRKIIAELCPDYLDSFDTAVNRTWGYMFNMMLMKQELFSDYCQWLFSVLFELEKRMQPKVAEYSTFQGRFYGRVSEIIFNVWLEHAIQTGKVSANKIKEIPYIYTEKIQQGKKIRSFLSAKFTHKRYEGSF